VALVVAASVEVVLEEAGNTIPVLGLKYIFSIFQLPVAYRQALLSRMTTFSQSQDDRMPAILHGGPDGVKS
jgi:hypothetical protein